MRERNTVTCLACRPGHQLPGVRKRCKDRSTSATVGRRSATSATITDLTITSTSATITDLTITSTSATITDLTITAATASGRGPACRG
jgi:hypothetical protein